MMNIWTLLFGWYWNRFFWLPEGVIWTDFDLKRDQRFGHYSDIYWAFLSAAMILRFRLAFERLFSKRFGQWLGVPKQKQRKFSECGWRCAYYTFSASYGLSVLWGKSWFWNVSECWQGAPYHTLDDDVWAYGFMCAGYYVGVLCTLFTDVKRKDFWVMFGHHVTTLGLMQLMWLTNLTRIGTVFLLLHDVSDPFLEAAKMCNYAKYEWLCDKLFKAFAVVWIVTRVYIYPFIILRSMFSEAPYEMPMSPAFRVIQVLSGILFVFHMMWTRDLIVTAMKSSEKGEVQDARSSSEEDNDESD